MTNSIGMIRQIEASELKKGDQFEDITPGSNGGEYIVDLVRIDLGEVFAYPVWDKHSEHMAIFSTDDIVEIITIKRN